MTWVRGSRGVRVEVDGRGRVERFSLEREREPLAAGQRRRPGEEGGELRVRRVQVGDGDGANVQLSTHARERERERERESPSTLDK